MKKFGIIAIICLLLASLTACGGGGGNVEEFTASIAGVWHRNANLLDNKITILEDGSWTHEDADGEMIEQGTIDYDGEQKTYLFVIDNSMYPVELKEGDGEVLYFLDNFYREDGSVSGFDDYNGEWYLDGDTDSNYYVISDGEWTYMESQGQGAVSAASGHLEWNNADSKMLLREYSEDDPVEEFDVSTTGEMTSADGTYILAEGSYSEDFSEDESAESGETSVVFDSYYYREGGSDGEEGGICFYEDGTFELDSPGQTGQGTWTYEEGVIYASFMEQTQEYIVEEGGNALVLPDSSRLILSGDAGAARNTGRPTLIMEELYFLGGDIYEPTWYFYADGRAEYDADGETFPYEYTIDEVENYITVIDEDGNDFAYLIIMDNNTLLDNLTDDRYIAALAEMEESSDTDEESEESGESALTTEQYYYYDNDVNDVSWCFFNDSRCEYTDVDGSTYEYTYVIAGSLVAVRDSGGNVYANLMIDGTSIVDSENGDTFVLYE